MLDFSSAFTDRNGVNADVRSVVCCWDLSYQQNQLWYNAKQWHVHSECLLTTALLDPVRPDVTIWQLWTGMRWPVLRSLVCKSSVKSCLQTCPGGICKSLQCTAGQCFQSCRGGGCDIMTCPRNATYCEQTSGKEMICDSLNCTQGCPGGKCNMTCSLSVKECRQSCIGGACVVQCDAEKCSFDCSGGICTKIKSATTPKPADSEPSTSKPTPTGTGGHIQFKPRLLFVFCLHLSVSSLREVLWNTQDCACEKKINFHLWVLDGNQCKLTYTSASLPKPDF